MTRMENTVCLLFCCDETIFATFYFLRLVFFPKGWHKEGLVCFAVYALPMLCGRKHQAGRTGTFRDYLMRS